jgi:hypothetical protein
MDFAALMIPDPLRFSQKAQKKMTHPAREEL